MFVKQRCKESKSKDLRIQCEILHISHVSEI